MGRGKERGRGGGGREGKRACEGHSEEEKERKRGQVW